MKYHPLAALLIAGTLAGARAETNPSQLDKKRINLLFIISDQFRFDAMSCAGNPVVKTPNLDRLASEGVRFATTYSGSPVCGPARATILSGCTIYHHGVVSNAEADGKGTGTGAIFPMKTFDQILAAEGYRCRYHGKWHTPRAQSDCYANFKDRVDKRLMFDPGYDELLESSGALRHEPVPGEVKMGKYSYVPNPMDSSFGKTGDLEKMGQPDYHGRLLLPAEYSETAFQAGYAIRSLQTLAGAGPFSLTCSIDKPHAPMLPTAPYSGMYPPSRMQPPESIKDPMENSPYVNANGRPRLPQYRDPERVKYFMSDYYGLIKEVDDWIGKILDALKASGQENNTLVIFTADHGEMLGAHGLREKNTFYEESVRVPLIMKLPGVLPAGKIVNTPVSQIDLYATILNYLKAGQNPSDGESLRRFIDKDDMEHIVVSEWASDNVPGYMIRWKNWKYLVARRSSSQSIDALYNLADDPHEMNNLIGRNPRKREVQATVKMLKDQLLAWLQANQSPYTQEIRERK